MSLHKYFVILIFALISTAAFAQQDQIQFSRIDLSNGLSHNQVNSILKDSKGFLWFGTLSGLNRYDGYQFKTFRHEAGDTTSIADDFITNIFELPDHKLYLETRSGANVYDNINQSFIRNVKGYLKGLNIDAREIRDILKDADGNFWFNATADGLFKYDVSTRRTLHFTGNGSKGSTLAKAPVAAIHKGPEGDIWVIHQDKSIEALDHKTGRVTRRIDLFRQTTSTALAEYKLFVDSSSDLWIYTLNNQHGIDYYSPRSGVKRYIDKGPAGLNNNLINGILQDSNGLIWIGTDHGGINLLDKRNFRISYLVNREDDVKSIGQNSITSLYKDDAGIIWIGTFKKGISFYHEKILKFPLYRHQLANPHGLTYDDVNRFVEDEKGNLWIGTNGGGLFYLNRKTGQFTRYAHQASNPNSLSNDIIVSLYIDKQKILWIGTYFGGLSSFDGKNFKHYRHNPQDPKSLADDRVWDIVEDRQGRLWVGTLSGGLDRLNRSTGTFTHKKAGQPNSVGSDFISCLLEDRQGNLWIGSSDGIDQLTPGGRFVHFKNEPGKANTLINNIVYDLMQDSYGFIWIATREGLSRLNPKTRQFKNFGSKEGLTEKATLKIVEDDSRNLWVSTSNGLFKILVKKLEPTGFSYSFRKYDEHDGLQGSAFNANAGYRTRAGELLFGGANGFNLFRPENIRSDNSKPAIVLTGLQIANQAVGIGQPLDGQLILNKSIVFTDTLNLRYDQNGLTFEFAALNFFSPRKIKYQYKLEGFDQGWQELPGDIRRAAYTNIDPGEYTFKVRSTDASGNWVNNDASLKIFISPPLWRTNVAYIFYVLVIGGTLLLMRKRGIQRAREEFMVEQERQQAKRMHELDLLKIKFLTNVSHEFRTPLSLIITPLEKLIRQAKDSEKEQLQMIQRNGRRLLNLVNQLLDFRRMEVHELKLHPKSADIIAFLRELCLSFSDVAERKHIALNFKTGRNSLITAFDHDKMERILFNVLSNAFKFTPHGGAVSVDLQTRQTAESHVQLVIKVQDTGIGIDPDKKDRIFERFFQSDVPDSMVNQGTGIGLSITKEFVKLHGGEIFVDSILNAGSTFTMIFVFGEGLADAPVTGELSGAPQQVLISPPAPANEQAPDTAPDPKSKKPVVLLVEDNDDFRFYLKDNLKEFYQIVEAVNGKEGWQKVLSVHPDLVVSDVSMPEMNGIDFCEKIKCDKRTAHIPVILLTALTNEDQQLTGLETGANDYMTKPFNFEILLSKIKNLLLQQALSRKTYQKQVAVKPVENKIESVDDKFIRQLSMHIEKHLADSSYSVDQLSADMNMSRVGLYKKILPLTGKSPVEYIRYYRLQKAKPLLESQITIAEVAYQVGFSNPKHFSKYFKQEFDMLPSAYAGAKSGKKALKEI
jgi:signal transduction histidine kinase/ligand-binding sensor domain-containing protein/DNA-binding response OmpR family regulator